MTVKIDSEEQIVLAKLSNFLTRYSNKVIKENGDGENLLRCAGVSSLYLKYEKELNPFSFNGSWKNPNDFFNPGFAINKICIELSENSRLLGSFLNEFLGRIYEIEEEDEDLLRNYLEVLGYNLNIEKDWFSQYPKSTYSISPYTAGVVERNEDISYLINKLNKENSELVTYYKEAISTYGNSEYQGCVSNCRTLFEKLFKILDEENEDYLKGILIATKETTPPKSKETPKLTKKGIFKYWLETNKGFNRFRFFSSLYSILSGLGPHGEETPTKEDALLCLRCTEDVLIWYFQNK